MALGIDDVAVGLHTDAEHHTGCTVILPPAGTVGGMAVRGGAPGTRESAVLGPAAPNPWCHAVVLSGSSLFGLRTADGVVDWCVEQGRGLSLHGSLFPIVGAAVVFDVRSPQMRRLAADAGRQACQAASTDEPAEGSVGVGTGCTVGKEAGVDLGTKGGQGIASVASGNVVVGALMGVNAFGSVLDEQGRIMAGSRAVAGVPRYPHASRDGFANAGGAVTNTVIGCVVTNARLDKASACRVADLAHTGIARTVSPAHTSFDGDAMFALATGRVDGSVDLVAELAAEAVARAVRSAVRHATPMPGWPVDERVHPADEGC